MKNEKGPCCFKESVCYLQQTVIKIVNKVKRYSDLAKLRRKTVAHMQNSINYTVKFYIAPFIQIKQHLLL